MIAAFGLSMLNAECCMPKHGNQRFRIPNHLASPHGIGVLADPIVS